MSEIVERVARVLCQRNGYDPDSIEPGDLPRVDGRLKNGDPGHFLWREFVAPARAAIEAMREPTDGMLEARFGNDALGCWQDMIDAALAKER